MANEWNVGDYVGLEQKRLGSRHLPADGSGKDMMKTFQMKRVAAYVEKE